MQFGPADPIGSAFAPLIGRRTWLVQKGHGSFLTLQFGSPHLMIREAMPDANTEGLRRPNVTVRGDWHLWIYCCTWRIEDGGKTIAHSESPDRTIIKGARTVDGQMLTSVEVDAKAGRTRFTFELGTTLHTTPSDDDMEVESWMLYAPDGNVLSFRADGCYSWAKGDTKPSDQVWVPTAPSAA